MEPLQIVMIDWRDALAAGRRRSLSLALGVGQAIAAAVALTVV